MTPSQLQTDDGAEMDRLIFSPARFSLPIRGGAGEPPPDPGRRREAGVLTERRRLPSQEVHSSFTTICTENERLAYLAGGSR